MAWIKIAKRNFVNADRITDVMMLQNRDGSHYIRFLSELPPPKGRGLLA